MIMRPTVAIRPGELELYPGRDVTFLQFFQLCRGNSALLPDGFLSARHVNSGEMTKKAGTRGQML